MQHRIEAFAALEGHHGPGRSPIDHGGFNNTSLALPENNDGKSGAVTAIVLCFGCPNVLPETEVAPILALTVEGEKEAVGHVKYAEGLVGGGEPVANVLTVNGASAPICNLDLAQLSVSIAAGKTFRRADANDDGKVNIADPIWIISELFRGGPATGCQATADANADTVIDLADATYIINYQFLGGDAPPAPFPDCDAVEELPEGITCDVEPSSCD